MPSLPTEPVDSSGCRECGGKFDPVRDYREVIHKPDCPWLIMVGRQP